MRLLAVFLAAFLGCCAAVAGVWSADRDPPTETISVKVMPDKIEAGGLGEVHYVYQRYRVCSRRTTVSVIDSTGRAFEFVPQSNSSTNYRVEGKADTYVRPFRVSIAAAPGPAVYQAIIEDRCNLLQWMWPIRRTVEVPFYILPRAPQASSLFRGEFRAAVLEFIAPR
ncbi:hypothetical protein [Aureimonas psammosilenae]|uniref:hypothetical protein n=1 Tax=Aureimonas psammosilenae TaxID=2495496 RepID=UPI0012605FE7|nr:hypothetical protein [Aureimonas psammosilenae]